MMANGPLLTGGAQDQLAKLYGHLGKQESTPRSPRTTSHIYLTNPSQEGTAVMNGLCHELVLVKAVRRKGVG